MKHLKTLFIALLTFLVLAGAGGAAVPVPADISCSQGEDCARIVVMKGAGKPLDLTGYGYRAMVRASFNDSAPLAEFVIDSGAAAQGMIRITLPAALTTQLAGKSAVWDLRQTDPSGMVSYPVRGNFKCYWSATR